MRNVTVDASDSGANATIVYTPPLCNNTGWSEGDSGHNGSHLFCSNSTGSRATFSFAGIAIYYLCPPNSVDVMQFSLDGSSPEIVNMSSFRGELTNINSSSIVWSKTGLPYGNHTLELSPGESRPLKVVVDAFTYTVPEEGDLLSTPASSATSGVVRPTGFTSSEGEVNKNKVPIIVGTIAGVIILSIFLALAFYLRRQAKIQKARYGRSTPIPPLSRHSLEDPQIYTTKGSVGTTGVHSVSLADSHQPHHRSEYVDSVALRPLPPTRSSGRAPAGPRSPRSPAWTDTSDFEAYRRGF